MPAVILALDFGGTKLTAGLFDSDGDDWLAHERTYSTPGANAHDDLSTMLAMANRLLQGSKPAAIGISFGGPVEADSGKILLSHHVNGWENFNLAEMLQREYGSWVSIDNDANAAALGEHRFGAGRGFSSLLYITVSTGVGGGWILNGQVWRGADSMAGEIGHTVIDPRGPECLCGKHGCLERLASGPYMAMDARLALQNDPTSGSILRGLCNGDPARISGEIVSQAAALGDPIGQKLLIRAAWSLGIGIGNAANLVNPQRIILGGGVTKSGAPFWDELRRVAWETALPQVNFEILPAALGDDAPLWGALALGLITLST